MNSFTQEYQKITIRYNKKRFERISTFTIMILIIALLFSSCFGHRNLEYLPEKDNMKELIIYYLEVKVPDYKLKPNDELSIIIKSLDVPAANVLQVFGFSKAEIVIIPHHRVHLIHHT
jgi:hypothetical protein